MFFYFYYIAAELLSLHELHVFTLSHHVCRVFYGTLSPPLPPLMYVQYPPPPPPPPLLHPPRQCLARRLVAFPLRIFS